MRVFLGMILGALLLIGGVYVYDFDVDLHSRQSARWRRPITPS